MTSSAKKKNEKKKDFQKTKLKVGKTKAKPDNATNTSFSARSIVVKKQSLHAEAPSVAALVDHHLSLVSSRQESQRREALSALANDLTTRKADGALPVATVTVVTKVRPCLIDGSKSIREHALRVLAALDPAQVAYSVAAILVYVHIGMVHLSTDIRLSSLDVLEWMVGVAPQETVACSGGWTKTLNTLVTLLRWQSASTMKDAKGWSTTTVGSGTSGRIVAADGKLKARHITVLAAVLEAGTETKTLEEDETISNCTCFPLWHVQHHAIGQRPSPFSHLALFGTVDDDDKLMYDNAAVRIEVFNERLYDSIRRGMLDARKEGGEIGRAATRLEKVLSRLGVTDEGVR